MWDPFTQESGATCIVDWSENGNYGGLADVVQGWEGYESEPILNTSRLASAA